MRYCQQCGAPNADQAKFCSSCGAQIPPKTSARTSDDGEGIVIDAPEEATVTISDGPDGTKAPDASGEFSVASWEATEARKPKTARTTPKFQQPPRVHKPQRVEEPEEVEPEEEPKKAVGLFTIIWTLVKILIIIVSIVLSANIIKGFFKSDTSEVPNQEQQEQQELPMQTSTSTQGDMEIPRGNTTDESQTNVTVNNNEEDELVFEGNQNSESSEDLESDSGFGSIEDMPLPERIEYLEGLLERSERYLQKELAKGDAANQNEIRQLRQDIDKLRKRLSQFKQ